MPVRPFWTRYCDVLTQSIWLPGYKQCTQRPLNALTEPLYHSSFLSGTSYYEPAFQPTPQQVVQLNALTSRIYNNATRATPKVGEKLNLARKKRNRDDQAPAPAPVLKTMTFKILYTTEQKKGKFYSHLMSNPTFSPYSIHLLTKFPFSLLLSSLLFSSLPLSSNILLYSPFPFRYTTFPYIVVRWLQKQCRFLYNEIVDAYSNGRVALNQIQREYSTSTSQFFRDHPHMLQIPANIRQGVCHDFVRNVMINQRKQEEDPNFRFRMKFKKDKDPQSLVVDKSKTNEMSPTLPHCTPLSLYSIIHTHTFPH